MNRTLLFVLNEFYYSCYTSSPTRLCNYITRSWYHYVRSTLEQIAPLASTYKLLRLLHLPWRPIRRGPKPHSVIEPLGGSTYLVSYRVVVSRVWPETRQSLGADHMSVGAAVVAAAAVIPRIAWVALLLVFNYNLGLFVLVQLLVMKWFRNMNYFFVILAHSW